MKLTDYKVIDTIKGKYENIPGFTDGEFDFLYELKDIWFDKDDEKFATTMHRFGRIYDMIAGGDKGKLMKIAAKIVWKYKVKLVKDGFMKRTQGLNISKAMGLHRIAWRRAWEDDELREQAYRECVENRMRDLLDYELQRDIYLAIMANPLTLDKDRIAAAAGLGRLNKEKRQHDGAGTTNIFTKNAQIDQSTGKQIKAFNFGEIEGLENENTRKMIATALDEE